MTGFMHEQEFSRKSFLKGGGALVVGFSLLGLAAKASAADSPYASGGPFDQTQVDSWLSIHADNTATIKSGVIEMGQGTTTGFLMIAAEELDLDMSQLKQVIVDTNVTPDQGEWSASLGIQQKALPLRAAAAAAKEYLLKLASANLGVPVASLTVASGVVSGGGKTITYGQLIGDKVFNVQMPNATGLAAGAPKTKPISQYKIVGKTGVGRVDIPPKVTGNYVYVHNIKVPGMLHGRVVRPRGQGGYGSGTAPKIVSVDEGSIRRIPGVKVIRYGDFVGVVAPHEYQAIQAAAQLKVTWGPLPTLSGSGNLWKQMRAFDSAGQAPARAGISKGNFESAFASAPLKATGTYAYHYNAPASIGPPCAVADVTPNGARIFTNTQNPYNSRQLVKNVLDQVMGANTLPLSKIRVTYYEGSSVYGPVSPYYDASQAAAILSALSGAPVRLQMMRWDDHGWAHYAPAQLTDVRGAVDTNGNILAFEFVNLGIASYSTNPSQQAVTGATTFATSGPLISKDGLQYNIPNQREFAKSLPLKDNYFKVTAMRAPNAPQSTFASEQMFDELAYLAKMDPIQFRRRNIATPATDPYQRWSKVLEEVARISNWQPRVSASNLSDANVVTGRGVAFGHSLKTMPAGVVDIEVNKKTGKIVVKNVYAALDVGFVVYPEGLKNNDEGAAMMGVSRAIYEEVAFNKSNVTSLDWVTYPILRFKEAPKVLISAVSRTDIPATDTVANSGSMSTGSGERAEEPMAAAIANAFFDATGVRLREAPMTPARVRAALKAAGVT